jgi:hypothetical protein
MPGERFTFHNNPEFYDSGFFSLHELNQKEIAGPIKIHWYPESVTQDTDNRNIAKDSINPFNNLVF